MNAEILEIKPSLWGISLNVSALLKRLAPWKVPSRVAVVAERFVTLFEDHGVSVTQIPRFIPQLSLASLQDPERLLLSLSPSLLDQVAKLFGVSRAWLDGTTDSIYECGYCYKAPERFFEKLSQIPRSSFESPVCFLFDGRLLDFEIDREQPLALVMREKVGEIEREAVFRYHIFGDSWDWSYAKCRIQLKAMIRIVEGTTKGPVYLYPCSPAVLARVRDGSIVPRKYFSGKHEMDAPLEDYALSPLESVCAREAEELPHVLHYIRAKKLAM